jgi:hypothetical protein
MISWRGGADRETAGGSASLAGEDDGVLNSVKGEATPELEAGEAGVGVAMGDEGEAEVPLMKQSKKLLSSKSNSSSTEGGKEPIPGNINSLNLACRVGISVMLLSQRIW